MNRFPKPWNREIELLYREEVSSKMEQLLDLGYGTCCLRDPQIRGIVSAALRFFNGTRYHLDSFVIMPNHVHVLFATISPNQLPAVLHGWKGYTSSVVCRTFQIQSPFWLQENWDTLIRDEDQFFSFRAYIRKNPLKARLRDDEYALWGCE
ncbi:MAG: transposase [Puniceicoccaceae bacterium]